MGCDITYACPNSDKRIGLMGPLVVIDKDREDPVVRIITKYCHVLKMSRFSPSLPGLKWLCPAYINPKKIV